jgi:hypothetical protein
MEFSTLQVVPARPTLVPVTEDPNVPQRASSAKDPGGTYNRKYVISSLCFSTVRWGKKTWTSCPECAKIHAPCVHRYHMFEFDDDVEPESPKTA